MSGFQVSAQEKDPAAFAMAIQELYSGRSNAAGSVVLTPGASTTVVNAPNCAPQCVVLLSAQTLSAAVALASTFVSASQIRAGSFTINHANDGQTDKAFYYVCLG